MSAFKVAVIVMLVAVGTDSASAQDRPARVARFSGDVSIGWYTVYDALPKRLTFREEEVSISRGVKAPSRIKGELRGVLEYPAGSVLGIVLKADGRATIAERLSALGALDANDVEALVVVGKCDLPELRLISRFGRLRELTVAVDESLEGEEGCTILEGLKNLRYLNVAVDDGCVFGSRRFCTAILALRELRFLSVPCEKFTESDIILLSSHSALESINLRARRPVCGSKSLEALRAVKNLRELFVVCTDSIRDIDVLAFADVRQLETLQIATRAPISCQERIKERRPDCWFFFQEPSGEAQ